MYFWSEPLQKSILGESGFGFLRPPRTNILMLTLSIKVGFFGTSKNKMAAAGCHLKKPTSLLMVVLLFVIAHFFCLEKKKEILLKSFFNLQLIFDPLMRQKSCKYSKFRLKYSSSITLRGGASVVTRKNGFRDDS